MKTVIAPTSNKLNAGTAARMLLLVCGILSSLLYVVMNIVCAILYEGYSSVSQTVSELSAIGAPTRSLWVSLGIIYSLLGLAFGWGVWLSAAQNRRLRIVGALLMAVAVIGFFWPPMHQRSVLAADGGTLTDTLHIIFTFITVPLMMLAVGFGAAALDKKFRFYSVATLVIILVFGILTGLKAPGIEANLPTPLIGVWERINIGAYLLWIVVLAVALIKNEKHKEAQG